ncbi:MAG: FRG domain-containing protein [Clostridiales bacterium]|nr:FRG domain-containing protein [Clostridiales bacterium]
MFRNKDFLFNKDELIVNVNCEYLLNVYKNIGKYYDIFKSVFGEASQFRMYELCAFSQHYLDFSPFVDFTKSLYVALSFALKNKNKFTDDIVLYTVEIEDYENYTSDIVTTECWLNNYSVTVHNFSDEKLKTIQNISSASIKAAKEAVEKRRQISSPKARLIDIPTNDLMKYQQGVFLLLTDYVMLHQSYLTKNLREVFNISKYIINKDICKTLLKIVSDEAPWYNYECLVDIKTAIQKSVEIKDL